MQIWLNSNWPALLTFFGVLLSLFTSIHTLLMKRDVRATISWFALVWLVPFVGPVLYALLGVNRIQRRAVQLQAGQVRYTLPPRATPSTVDDIRERFSTTRGGLARLMSRVTSRPLVPGNAIDILVNGDQAYPAMLAAIDEAKDTINLETYIFDGDELGGRFVDALARAKDRGVDVRVLVDAAGLRYHRPHIDKLLKKRGVRCAKYLPIALARLPYFNLRNHRKVLIVDGRLGFTGGMNIRAGHALELKPKSPVQDVHFRLEGPIVAHLQEVFAEDWLFATKEAMDDRWFPDLEPRGEVIARGIVDGPDDRLYSLVWTLIGAIQSAHRSIKITTPYFLPDDAIVQALKVAAMRGIEVDIIVPEKSNLPIVGWSMWAHYWMVLGHGVRIWMSPEPFDHSKLMIIDDYWSLFGSTNWDPRSLRLNFEFNVEAYDEPLAKTLSELFEAKKANARLLTQGDVENRPPLIVLRDAIAHLMTPYL